MKRQFLLLFSLLFVCCYCSNVFAFETDVNTLKRIASNINYDYSYVEKDNSVTFTIRFTNVYSDVYIHDVMNDKNYAANANGEVIISGYSSNKKYKFEVKNKNEGKQNVIILPTWDGTKYYDKIITLPGESVSSTPLYIIYINLPAYNPYYDDEVCKGFETYQLCQKWVSNNLSYDEFVREVTKAKEKNNVKDKVINEKKEYTIIDYFRDNILFITIATAISVVIIVLVINYIRDKNNGFEGW